MLTVAPLSAETLASVLDQSVDCVKFLRLDGTVQWMNANGLCAMEIDALEAVRGRSWADLWPTEAAGRIASALADARAGEPVRFDAFCPTVRGTARWWNVTVSVVDDVDGRAAGYLAISRDVTEAESARQALEVAIAEMRHRLKNTYAMVGSLLLGFARGDPANEAFARTMNDRMVTLSAAQTLFADGDAPTRIDHLIPALVVPFDGINCPVTTGRLPSVMVSRGEADAIALVLGELAVNSAKHGALATGGSVAVDADAAAGLCITWQESSHRPVGARSRHGGQGLVLIDRIVRARRGTIDIDWHSHGLTVRLAFQAAAAR